MSDSKWVDEAIDLIVARLDIVVEGMYANDADEFFDKLRAAVDTEEEMYWQALNGEDEE